MLPRRTARKEVGLDTRVPTRSALTCSEMVPTAERCVGVVSSWNPLRGFGFLHPNVFVHLRKVLNAGSLAALPEA